MDKLEFSLRQRLDVQPPGARVNSAMDGYRQKAEYIDFIVNGRSLADVFEIDQRDLVSMLTPQNLHAVAPVGREVFNRYKRSGQLVNELLLELPCRYEFRRVHIYGCPECGDLGCGSVTMQLIETPTTVIWQRFDDGREDYANYMSEEKSFNSGDLFDLWQARGHDYAVLDAFGLSNIEMDYEYLHALKSGKISPDPNADLHRGDSIVIDFPEIGPFEFDKAAYLAAFVVLRQNIELQAR